MKRFLHVFVATFVAATTIFCTPLFAFDKAPNVKDQIAGIKAQPLQITESIFSLTDENGKLVEAPTARKTIRHFNWIGKTLSVIQYNNSGLPYLYEKLKFTGDGLIEEYTFITKSDSIVKTYEYTPDFSGYTVYNVGNNKEKQKVTMFSVEKEDDSYVSFEYSYNADGTINTAKKTLNYTYTGDLRKDITVTELPQDTVYYYYYKNGKISSVIAERATDTKQRKTYYQDNKRYKEETFDLNEYGDCIKETTSDTIYIYKYTYDANGNWTQKDTFFQNKTDDFQYSFPLLRTKREIVYSGSVASPQIPTTFYSFDSESDKLYDEEIELAAGDDIDKPFTSLKIDPIDDKQVLYIVFNAPQKVNEYVDNVTLVIKKKEGYKPELYVNWKEFLNERSCYVTYRIDDEKAKTEEWLLSTDEKASFYNGDIASLLEKLKKANQFIVRTTPFNEPPCTAIFNVSALKNLEKQYSWLYNKDYNK